LFPQAQRHLHLILTPHQRGDPDFRIKNIDITRNHQPNAHFSSSTDLHIAASLANGLLYRLLLEAILILSFVLVLAPVVGVI